MSALIGIVHPKMICSSSCFSKTRKLFLVSGAQKEGSLKNRAALFHTVTVHNDATYKKGS